MEHTQSFQFFNRGPSSLVRLAFFSLLSLFLLFVDARYSYLEFARAAMYVPIHSLQRLAILPGELLRQANTFLVAQSTLVSENEKFDLQHRMDAAKLQQFEVLQAENEHLRTLLAIQQQASFPMQVAEIIYLDRDIFKQKLLLDKGASQEVKAGQVVMDDRGIVGQVTRVYPWLSEVTLITDKDHAVPVQVLRSGLRAVVFGSGDADELELRYMPISADIQVGDELMTSGIDGTYMPGLPVAKVVSIERDPAYPFARILCKPVAGVGKYRQLLILSGLPEFPQRPEILEESVPDKRAKNKRKVP